MDWCFRMKKGGWKIIYVHEAKVMHHLGKTIGSMNRQLQYFDELYDNTMLFYAKHYGDHAVVIYKLLLMICFLPRSLYWGLRNLLDGSEGVTHMCLFSWKSLWLGMRFWIPLKSKPAASVSFDPGGG
jgi:GT2 family glycosyltransferase